MGIPFHINTTMTPQHITTQHNTTQHRTTQHLSVPCVISEGCYLNKQNIFLKVYKLGHAS